MFLIFCWGSSYLAVVLSFLLMTFCYTMHLITCLEDFHCLAYPSCELISTWASIILQISWSSDLSWSNHIKDISSPATLRTFYTALIHPHLEYAVPVWDPHLCKDIDALESVQRFTTTICTKSWNTNYLYHLDKLGLQTLKMRTSYLKQCHLYRLLHGLSIFPNSPITTSSISSLLPYSL